MADWVSIERALKRLSADELERFKRNLDVSKLDPELVDRLSGLPQMQGVDFSMRQRVSPPVAVQNRPWEVGQPFEVLKPVTTPVTWRQTPQITQPPDLTAWQQGTPRTALPGPASQQPSRVAGQVAELATTLKANRVNIDQQLSWRGYGPQQIQQLKNNPQEYLAVLQDIARRPTTAEEVGGRVVSPMPEAPKTPTERILQGVSKPFRVLGEGIAELGRLESAAYQALPIGRSLNKPYETATAALGGLVGGAVPERPLTPEEQSQWYNALLMQPELYLWGAGLQGMERAAATQAAREVKAVIPQVGRRVVTKLAEEVGTVGKRPIEVGDIITTKVQPLGVPPETGMVVGEGTIGKNIPAWKVQTAPDKFTAISKDSARLLKKGTPPKPVAKVQAARAAEAPVAKEPWQMTRAEYGKWYSEHFEGKDIIDHKIRVGRALSEGKPVPPEVLKDYPDLAAGAVKPVEAVKVLPELSRTVVKDITGNPQIVYHGTPAQFEKFAINKAKPALYGKGFYFTDAEDIAVGYARGKGVVKEVYLDIQKPFVINKVYTKEEVGNFLTRFRDTVEQMGGYKDKTHENFAIVYPKTARLLKNPQTVDGETLFHVISEEGTYMGERTSQTALALQDMGYDGISYTGGLMSGGKKHNVWIAFREDQIKYPGVPKLVEVAKPEVVTSRPAEGVPEAVTPIVERPVTGAGGAGGAAPPAAKVSPVAPKPEPGNKFVAALRPNAEIQKEVVTSDNPLIRAAIGKTGINPSILQNTPSGKALVAYYRQMVETQELTDVAVSATLDVHTERFTGRLGKLLPIDNNGFLKGTDKPWQDVFSRPGEYAISAKGTPLRTYIDDYLKVVDEVETMRIAEGLKPRSKLGEEGWFYVPRQVKTIRGVELRRPSSPALQRHYEEAVEGFAKGIRYDTNPRATLELHIRKAYQEIAEKQLSDVLEPLSISAKELVPQPIVRRMQEAIKTRMAAERAARKEIQAAAQKAGKVPMPSTFAKKVYNKPEVVTARQQYYAAKMVYTKAMEAARKAEVAPGNLFGRAEETIAIGTWRNRFFPLEQAKQLQEGLSFFGGMPKTSPWMRGIEITGNHIRFLASVGDFAAPFIQGLPLLAENPNAWARATLRHYQAILDPTVQARLIRNHLDTFQWMAQHEISIGDPEFFAALKTGQGFSAGKLLEILPKGEEIRRVAQLAGRQSFGRFQATYNTFLGYSRAKLLEAIQPTWAGTDAELSAYIRNMTGGLDSRALGVGPSQRALESVWLAFSPRLLRSTMALVGDAMRPTTPQGQAALKSLAKLAAGVTGVYIASGLAMGKSWDDISQGLNPLNGKKFLSYEIDGDWIGVGGQVRAILQLVARSVSALAPGGEPAGTLATISQFENPIISFYTMRGAPALNIVGTGIEALSKGKIDALPFNQVDSLPDLFKHIGTSALPFAVQGVLEGQQAITNVVQLTGLRTSPPSPSEKVQALASPLGKDWEQLEPYQKAQLYNSPEGRDLIRKNYDKDFIKKYETRWKYYDAQLARDEAYKKDKITGSEWLDAYQKAEGERVAVLRQIDEDLGTIWDAPKTPEEKAMSDYFTLQDTFRDPKTNLFNTEGWSKAKKKFLASVTPEIAGYIERNTGTYDTPTVKIFKTFQKKYLQPYWDIEDQVWAQYSPSLRLVADYIKKLEDTGKPADKAKANRNLAKYPEIVIARATIARLEKQYRRDVPLADDLLKKYYSR